MKKILSFSIIVCLIVSLFSMVTIPIQGKDSEDIKVRIHYHRFDDQYEGWNVWLWPEGGDGNAYSFTSQDEFGAVLESVIQKNADVTQLGIIIRLNEWEAKDIDQDRFIEVAQINSEGILEIYVVQSESDIYYQRSKVNLDPKIVSAKLIDPNKIEFSVTIPFDLEKAESIFKIQQSDGTNVKIKDIISVIKKTEVSKAVITLEKELDLNQQYTIEGSNYAKFPISMSKAFDFPDFVSQFTYTGSDLGSSYSPEKTSFRVWAPTSEAVSVLVYDAGIKGNLVSSTPMKKDVQGTYIATVQGDLNQMFYTYQVTINGKKNEAVDPYATSVGVNGDRAEIMDIAQTDPKDWKADQRPELVSANDSIIYELHIRDLSTSESSGITEKGKYLGLTELGTKNSDGLSTGLDHIKELGVTHVQLLPVFDYRSIDETTLEKNEFNWGYDPKNYNVPEGSYSTDPYEGGVRIKEFKTMVQTLHQNDLRVVMDVVYNHTGASNDSNLNILVPDYYYRTVDGTFSNGSGCGNETASERLMVRKLIVDSVVFWATEYHIDGFRFDLMGLHDIETMKAVREALDKVDPSILTYGEGWTGGSCPLSESLRLVKANTSKVPSVGVFSDDLRDGIKGNVFEDKSAGFVNGAIGLEESVKFGIVGATLHDQINYLKVNYSVKPWALEPAQSINYVEAHDNLTLWDKLAVTNAKDSIKERIAMDQMSAAIFLTSQGIPFIHAGMEFLRSKEGDENSYKSPDRINQIDWSLKSTNINVFHYYKGLIELRKAHPAFRMTESSDINKNLAFFGTDETFGALQLPKKRMVGYVINNHANKDEAGAICVLFNANKTAQTVSIPDGEWDVVVNKDTVNVEGIDHLTGNQVLMQPIETVILISKEPVDITKVTKQEVDKSATDDSQNTLNPSDDSLTTDPSTFEKALSDGTKIPKKSLLPLFLGALGVIGISGIGIYFYKKKRKE